MDNITLTPFSSLSARDTEILEWLHGELDRMGRLLRDYEAGTRRIGRMEGGRLVDETQEEISNLKQRIAQIGLIMANF